MFHLIVLVTELPMPSPDDTHEMSITVSGRTMVCDIFGEDSLSEFADDAIGVFTAQGPSSFSSTDSTTAKLNELLKKTARGSVLNKLMQSFLITCPHSMITEMAIKHHTILKTDIRASMSRSVINKTDNCS